MKKIKNYSALLLLCILLFAYCATFFNAVQLQIHKQIVFFQLEDKQTLQEIKLSLTEWEQIIKSNNSETEIVFENKMFDIKKTKKTGTNITIYGTWDDTEDALKLRISKALDKKNKLHNKAPFLTLLFCNPIETHAFNMFCVKKNTRKFNYYLSFLFNKNTYISPKPPRLIGIV